LSGAEVAVEVQIRSRHVEVPGDVRAVAREKVARLARFLDGMDHAEVLFSEERNPRIADKEVCEVTLSGHGHHVRAKAAGPDHLVAIDRVVDKVEHRLEKLKGKLVGRSHPRRSAPVGSTAQNGEELDGEQERADDGEARIVKTKRFSIKPMTPEEAVLQMELLGHDFFFFTNAENDQAAVVYRRDDGFVGLIESA
jgi:putative sigma-54 modulation protein